MELSSSVMNPPKSLVDCTSCTSEELLLIPLPQLHLQSQSCNHDDQVVAHPRHFWLTVSSKIQVTPYRVPHRDEYSETVGFIIERAQKSALFLPDIDSWEGWEQTSDLRIEDIVEQVDYAFIDATFYDDFELPGRDMSLIPHPRVTQSMDLLAHLPGEQKAGVRFIHYNHTNPIRFTGSEQSESVSARGFNVAREGDRHCLAVD